MNTMTAFPVTTLASPSLDAGRHLFDRAMVNVTHRAAYETDDVLRITTINAAGGRNARLIHAMDLCTSDECFFDWGRPHGDPAFFVWNDVIRVEGGTRGIRIVSTDGNVEIGVPSSKYQDALGIIDGIDDVGPICVTA